MLSGTDLNHAFSFALDDNLTGGNDYDNQYSGISSFNGEIGGSSSSARDAREQPSKKDIISSNSKPSKAQQIRSAEDLPPATRPTIAKAYMPPQPSNVSFENAFLAPTPDQKIQMLSLELAKQRDFVEQQRTNNESYFEKLMGRRKDILKFMLFSLVIVFALSIHHHVKHYYKSFFQSHVLTREKEFGMRLLYPLATLFLLWNLRVFVR